MKRYYFNFSVALKAVLSNKLRSILTGLGIIFGVAAVIAMLAIGSGAQREILDQIKLVGVNNIVITPIVEQEEGEVKENSQKQDEKNFSAGLNMHDVNSIKRVIPNVASVSPEIVIDTDVIRIGRKRSAKLVGVSNSYFKIANFSLAEGKLFNNYQMEKGESVCVIGSAVKAKFFSQEKALGKRIKVGSHWLKVIGVLEQRFISKKEISNLGIRDYNMDVYSPLSTILLRYRNRSLVTNTRIQRALHADEDEPGIKDNNYHQLDRLTIQVDGSHQVKGVAQVVSKLLKRRHFNTVDFEISIPELLLKQQQRTKSIFNFVLGAIAGISLLVGGIGIMNIMLASVMERIKEIGLRMSIGAKKQDIVLQFLLEAVMISITGGVLGVILGVAISSIVSITAQIPTIISGFSIIISFGVAVLVGVLFGITPARQAANQDPIVSLRHE